MSGRGLARADLVTGLVFVALGAGVVIESLRMPRFAELRVEPYTAPGVVPGMLGLIILALGGILCLRAAREGGFRPGGAGGAWSRDPGVRRLLLSLLLTLGYAAGLVGRLPFWLATFLFVAAFAIVFEWPLARNPAERRRRVAFAVGLAAALSAVISYVFQEIFLVRLP